MVLKLLWIPLGIVGAVQLVPRVSSADQYNCVFTSACSSTSGCSAVEDFLLTFILDEDHKTALLIGNNGNEQVTAITGNALVSFLEILPSGVVQSTTVGPTGAALHSRHTYMSAFETFIASQHYGTCDLIPG